MKAKSQGASAPVNTPSNKLCAAGDLLYEARAVALFVAGAVTNNTDADFGIEEHEAYGFHIVMHDMASRIARASALIDAVRKGEPDHV